MLIFSDLVAASGDSSLDYRNTVLTRRLGVASFTILVWDHVITFSDEVELIWRGSKGPAVYLFFLNRYLIPLSFIVNIWAYFHNFPTSDSETRHHFVRFEGAMTMIGISIVAIMMFLRIRALYQRVLTVQAIVIAILLVYIGVNSWLLYHGIAVDHPPDAIANPCTMIIDPKIHRAIASSTAWFPLLYDTVVVALTLYRTADVLYRNAKTTGQIFRALLEEGLLYYSVICTVTLTLTIMIASTEASIRNVTAQLELCLTVAMMSRITLHLKGFVHHKTTVDSYVSHRHVPRTLPPLVARPGPHVPPQRVRETPSLETTARFAFPAPVWSTSAHARFAAVPEGESFAMESFSSVGAGAPPPQPSFGLRKSVADDPAPPVPIDLDVLYIARTAGDEELAGSRGGA